MTNEEQTQSLYRGIRGFLENHPDLGDSVYEYNPVDPKNYVVGMSVDVSTVLYPGLRDPGTDPRTLVGKLNGISDEIIEMFGNNLGINFNSRLRGCRYEEGMFQTPLLVYEEKIGEITTRITGRKNTKVNLIHSDAPKDKLPINCERDYDGEVTVDFVRGISMHILPSDQPINTARKGEEDYIWTVFVPGDFSIENYLESLRNPEAKKIWDERMGER